VIHNYIHQSLLEAATQASWDEDSQILMLVTFLAKLDDQDGTLHEQFKMYLAEQAEAEDNSGEPETGEKGWSRTSSGVLHYIMQVLDKTDPRRWSVRAACAKKLFVQPKYFGKPLPARHDQVCATCARKHGDEYQ